MTFGSVLIFVRLVAIGLLAFFECVGFALGHVLHTTDMCGVPKELILLACFDC